MTHDADERLASLWDEARRDDYSEAFPRVVSWLHSSNRDTGTEEATTWRSLRTDRPRVRLRLAWAALLVLGFAIACQVPITRSETIGYVLSWRSVRSYKDGAALLSEMALPAASNLSASTNIVDDQISTLFQLVLPGASEEEAHRTLEAVRSAEEDAAVEVRAFHKNVTRPLYAVALRTIDISVHVSSLSEEEVLESIHSQLRAQGINRGEVTHTRDSDGIETIHIVIPEEP